MKYSDLKIYLKYQFCIIDNFQKNICKYNISKIFTDKIEELSAANLYLDQKFLLISIESDLNNVPIELYSNIIYVNKKDLLQILENNFSNLSSIKSKYYLPILHKKPFAQNTDYRKNLFVFFKIFILILLIFPNIFCIILTSCILTETIFKTSLFLNILYANVKINIIKNSRDLMLPNYTILIALYQEAGNIDKIFKSIQSIDYPTFKLDVKIIIEADDFNMIKELLLIDIPEYFHIIKVPYSLPRTKPKALNYAMDYAYGDYITIYDAEDVPEPDQLLKIIQAFQSLHEDFICVQAKLCFYNESQNILSRLFTIEYNFWFEYVLPGLSNLGLPVTLGGTSNHFKAKYLSKLGFWDAYNVTEDAELGVRIYEAGYKTSIIDSYTYEEAVISIKNWLHQRSRWIKGFIQTFIILLKHFAFNTKLKWYQKLTLFILLGLSTLSFVAIPILFISVMFIKLNFIIQYIIFINAIISIIYLNFVGFFILSRKKQSIKNFKLLDIIILCLWPFYFLLHSIAAYKAIWELIFRPFSWNKTEHGFTDN
jgi:cellulose synthase/poly-beta-1,6-N-acetylglucosamine synthase-like glycosyltransferase